MTDTTPKRVPSIVQAMDFIEAASHGKVWIERKGKEGKWYPTVALRVEAFRRFFYVGEWAIRTKLIKDEHDIVQVRASIVHLLAGEPDDVIATGIAEEVRGAGRVNQTSAVENAETSAIGRALASFGLHGGEMASANEMEQALSQQERPAPPKATEAQLTIIIDQLKQLGMDEAETAQSLRVERLADLTEARADRLLVRLNEKMQEIEK